MAKELNKNQDKRFNEYRATVKGKEIIKHGLTERGHVIITERDAKINNRPGKVKSTGLYYELAEQPKKESKPADADTTEKAEKKPGRPAKNK